jgi:hypothetical protein
MGGGTEGSNVFFTTRERLVSSDTDEQIDLYDAREGGGFPGEGEVGSPSCRGEACQTVGPPPVIPSPGSSGFQGSGNVKPRKCPKGKVKKNGKCTKVKKAKKRRAGSKNATRHGHKKADKSNRGGAK